MSHLMRCEDVIVGTRLRYLGRPFQVETLKSVQSPVWGAGRLAVGVDGRSFVVHDGFTVWAMEDQS